MKRRNFIFTTAAAAAAVVIPSQATPTVGVDWGALRSDFGCTNVNERLERIYQYLNPVTFLKAYGASPRGTTIEIHGDADIHHDVWALEDVPPNHLTYGRHIDACEIPDDIKIHWHVGPYYAELIYILPSGHTIGFAMGEIQTPACRSLRPVELRANILGLAAPSSWLHVRGDFVQTYIKAQPVWGDEPAEKVSSSIAIRH